MPIINKTLNAAIISVFAALIFATPYHAIASDDVFRQAVNYVFLGNVNGDPTPDGERILSADQDTCVVVKEDVFRTNSSTTTRQWKYYLKRILAMNSSPYGGLLIEGDEPVAQLLVKDGDVWKIISSEKRTLIPLYGNIERTTNALRLIFSKFCPPKAKAPF